MKKIISIILIATMLFSFAACNKDKGSSTPQETVSLNVEVLKNDWQNGEIIINDKTVKLPCKVSELVEQSGLKIGNADIIINKVLKSKESTSFNLVGDGVVIRIKAVNKTSEDGLNCMDATVVQYSFNNTNPGNKQVKFAGTLTAGVTRAAVEEALGVPEDQTSDDTLYYFNGKNEKGKKVELIISFNSDDIVNSVSYEVK